MSESIADKGVVRLAGPLVISFWLRAAMTMVIDTVYARYLPYGDAALAALALTAPFDFLMIACWVGTSNGLTARLGAAIGGQESDRVSQLKRAAFQIILVLMVLFLGIAWFIWSFADKLSPDPEVATQFRIYATVVLGGSGITAFWAILPDSIVKAHQDTRSTMWAGLISGVTNLILNTTFVFVFHWGIFGIALATVLARVASLAYALKRAQDHERRRIATTETPRPGVYSKPRWAILSIAIPSAITFVLMAVESQAILEILKTAPNATPTLAGWSVFDRAVRFLAMPAIATSVALLPLAARYWGKGDLQGVKRELRIALLACLVYVVVFVLPVVALFGSYLADYFTESDLAQRAAQQGLWLLPLAVGALSPFLMLRSTLEGLQRPRPGLLFSILRSVVLVVPLVYLGVHQAPRFNMSEMMGACIGYVAGMLSAALLFAWWTNSAMRDLKPPVNLHAPRP